ncbi:MAG: TetR/AcrR family transcriptional regulator, partial [Elusimicrobia bacterium]|nr:TetR/AcrR family transcriptional regulator [Elusimicrobiota bacterium]
MARPPNLEAREHILDAALGLFHARGYRGVSMDDVAAEAKLGKSNLFHYYPSKDELGVAVLERACRSAKADVTASLAGDGDPVETVKGIFDSYAAGMEKSGCYKGCFIGNMAQEMSDENEDLRLRVAEHLRFWTAELAGFLRRRKEAGALRRDLDCEAAAAALVSLLEGGTLMAKA